MMRIISVSHSLIHPRQQMLFEKIGELNLAEVTVLSPSTWWKEKCIGSVKHNYELHCLQSTGNSFYTLRLRGLKQYIEEFSPDVLYSSEEPHTILSRECAKIAKEKNIPFAVFSWENTNRRFGQPYDDIEKEVIKKADILIVGTEDAKKRYMVKGVDEDKIKICPQTGVNGGMFKPMSEIDKKYDLVYHGRFVQEKGVNYIQDVAKELELTMLWIGGRIRDFIPTYGFNMGWASYLKLPALLNSAKIGIQFPYSYNGFSEQGNYGVAELMSLGLPVICSDNGSLKGVYGSSPAIIVHEEDVYALKKEIQRLLKDEDLRKELGKEGREWVEKKLSLQVIGKKTVKILKGATK